MYINANSPDIEISTFKIWVHGYQFSDEEKAAYETENPEANDWDPNFLSFSATL